MFHVKHEDRPHVAAAYRLRPTPSPGRPAPISRRSIVSLMASLASASLSAPASAIPESTPGAVSLAGQLLIATPAIGDPRFAHTVILMARHSMDGAMGITINRPIGVRPMADLLRAMGEDSSGADGEIRIFAGGPVQPQIGFVLHEAEYHQTDTIDIDGRVAMTSNRQIIRDICHHAGPQRHLVAFGYAGWVPHQLEAELAQHAWVTTPDDPALVFDEDPANVWASAMARVQRGP